MSKRLIVAVTSCERLPNRRHAALTSWVKAIRKRQGVEAFFVVGGYTENNIKRGQLCLAVPDGYEDLSFKTHQMLKWVDAHYDFDYFFKADDDTFVAVDRLIDRLEEGGDYVGHRLDDYASGGAGYLLSAKALKVAAKRYRPELGGCEDILLARSLAPEFEPQHDGRFQHAFEHPPSIFNDKITTHWVNDPERWEKVLTAYGRN